MVGRGKGWRGLAWLITPPNTALFLSGFLQILRRKPDLLLSNVETTVASKFRQLQDLFPEGDVVSMVERDATVLFYDFDKSINVKVGKGSKTRDTLNPIEGISQDVATRVVGILEERYSYTKEACSSRVCMAVLDVTFRDYCARRMLP